MIKTTKQDFEDFKAEAEYWIKRFGILGWRFYFDWKDPTKQELGPAPQSALAWCFQPDNLEDRVFTLVFPKTIDEELRSFITYDYRRAAFHEVCEALLFRLAFLAKSRVGFTSDIHEEVHHIIRTLEVSVWDFEERHGILPIPVRRGIKKK